MSIIAIPPTPVPRISPIFESQGNVVDFLIGREQRTFINVTGQGLSIAANASANYNGFANAAFISLGRIMRKGSILIPHTFDIAISTDGGKIRVDSFSYVILDKNNLTLYGNSIPVGGVLLTGNLWRVGFDFPVIRWDDYRDSPGNPGLEDLNSKIDVDVGVTNIDTVNSHGMQVGIHFSYLLRSLMD